MADPAFVHFIAKKLSEGYNAIQALRMYAMDAAAGESLNKQYVGTVDFLGDTVKVFTVNGQFTRSPTGADVIEFTMGGNWYGGTKKGTYWPICAEDEIVLHELMPPVDMIATAVHELIERYVIKYIYGITAKSTQEEWSKAYDEAHALYSEPAERVIRAYLEA
jgi:hypothetical protein